MMVYRSPTAVRAGKTAKVRTPVVVLAEIVRPWLIFAAVPEIIVTVAPTH